MIDSENLSHLEAKICERYIDAASQHGDCTERGDYKVGNAAYERLTRARGELKQLPDRGEGVLMKLVAHPNEWVRAAASEHLLPLREQLGIALLEQLAASPSRQVAFDAKMVLREWRAGRLKNIRQLRE